MNPTLLSRRGPTFTEEGQDYLLASFVHVWPSSGSDHSHPPFISGLWEERTLRFLLARLRVRSLMPSCPASAVTSFAGRGPWASALRRNSLASARAPFSSPFSSGASIVEAVSWLSPVQRNVPSGSITYPRDGPNWPRFDFNCTRARCPGSSGEQPASNSVLTAPVRSMLPSPR